MKKTNENAITLIALIITIIILVILSGIAIVALTQTGLFENAKQAKNITENAQREENDILSSYNNKISEIADAGIEGSREQITVDKEEYEQLKKDVIDLKNQISQNSGSNYSTTEQEIGTWIDGKKLYRKVINVSAFSSSGIQEVSHNIKNVDTIYINYGSSFVMSNSGKRHSLQYTSTSKLTDQWHVYIDTNKIYLEAGTAKTGYSAYIIIEYTKK